MNTSIFKAILAGAFIGAFLFFIPKFLLFLFLIFGLIKFLFFRRNYAKFREHRLAFLDKVRNMDDEEFSEFKNRFGQHRCQHHRESKP